MNEANAGFLQLLVPDIAADKMLDGTPATCEKMLAGRSGRRAGRTLGAYIAVGPARLAALWPDLQYAHEDPLGITHGLTCWKMGHGKHHGVESGAQIGALINMMWNRDPMCHTHTNFQVTGLPRSLNETSRKSFSTREIRSSTRTTAPMDWMRTPTSRP